MIDESSCTIKKSDLEFPKDNEIGRGAFGKVLLATVKGTGEKVAIKKVFQDRRYKNRELSILKELKHVNCCYLYDYFYTTASDNPDEEYLNLIMEYMPETLYREVRNYSKQKKNLPLLLIKLYSYQKELSILRKSLNKVLFSYKIKVLD